MKVKIAKRPTLTSAFTFLFFPNDSLKYLVMHQKRVHWKSKKIFYFCFKRSSFLPQSRQRGQLNFCFTAEKKFGRVISLPVIHWNKQNWILNLSVTTYLILTVFIILKFRILWLLIQNKCFCMSCSLIFQSFQHYENDFHMYCYNRANVRDSLSRSLIGTSMPYS